MTDFLNKLLANFTVMEHKTHSMHTDMVGNLFMSEHSFFDEVYNYFFSKKDLIRERIRILGEFPSDSLEEIISLSDIKEIKTVGTIAECLNSLINDLKLIHDMLKEGYKECGDDLETQQILIDFGLSVGVFEYKAKSTLSLKK